jgi:Na+-translocating ferredoxin:NAD+ oxidoreductase RnfE subunit
MKARSDTELAVIVLALCPAAAACTRLIDALWLSAGMVFVLAMTSGLSVLTPPRAPRSRGQAGAAAWGVFLVSACCAGIFELLLAAAAPAAAARLGIYVPLVAVTAPSMGRIVEREPGASLRGSLRDTVARAALFTSVLLVVTAFREVAGAGTITLGRTIPVGAFFQDPARAVALGGGALICLGYAAGAAQLLQSRRAGLREEDGAR